jgi:hypothetical protein
MAFSNIDTLELELKLQNPIDSSDIEEIKKELKFRYNVMEELNRFPDLDMRSD